MAALRDRVAALEAELHFADRELRKVKDREQKLLDKILDKSQGGQFYDSDLVHSFRNIREEIQRLAKSPLYTTGGNTRRPWVAENSDNEAFFEQWYGVPRKERQLLIRGEMFGYLHRYIFACNLFGISATGVAEALTFRDMETNLNHFERVLQNQGGKHKIEFFKSSRNTNFILDSRRGCRYGLESNNLKVHPPRSVNSDSRR